MCTKSGYTNGEMKGSSPELMPSIMGAFDAIIGGQTNEKDFDADLKTSTPRRTHQVSNFANLSPHVQKILSNVPDQEISKKFSSDETLTNKRLGNKPTYRSFRSPDKLLNKSTENLEIISSNVQKMLSNLPDTELVISASNLNVSQVTKNFSRNSSYLFNNANHNGRGEYSNGVSCTDGDVGVASHNGVKQFLYYSDGTNKDGGAVNGVCERSDVCEGEKCGDNCEDYNRRPLGSYLHSSHGIASRMPVGRKNMGKYLQVPSESSVGNTSSTTSSEVSRPVSLTSLGSCSSSGSSGHHQPGSAYLASAESLDSDPEPTGSQDSSRILFSGSADSGIAEQEQSFMTPEQRVLQEVLETETVYVADLKEVIQGYLEPWRADPECPLAQHLQHLFSNLEEIYEFNRSFLEDLREAACEATKTANCFLHHDSGFSVYNEYCTYYPRTMEVLGELTRNENMSLLFRERQVALGHALPLGSYLLKPVQRILKYHLLLQRLSKQCEPVHKPAVDLALTTMTGIASDINNMKRKHEDAVRVQEIQAQLYGWHGPDLTALGELIAEGNFRVVGARGRRHVFLFETVLLLAKSKQDGVLAYKSHIMCSNLMLVEQCGEPLSFQVLPFDEPKLLCTLKARSPQHKREWTLQIKRVILENYSAVIPNHARQLVLQLGQDLNGTKDTTDKWSPLTKHNTPHYLERRSRVRKTRDFTNRRASSQDRTFPSLGNWRRKSEPGNIPQYNSKTIPKKIAKMKKAKECGNAKFYTDLSDSETCDVAGESTESLPRTSNGNEEPADGRNDEEEERTDVETVKSNLEKIVSEILMQNQNFHKAFCRQNGRKHPTSDLSSVWYEERPKLPSKADSLPRSFQLNDQIDANESEQANFKSERLMPDESLKEYPDIDGEEQHVTDLSSPLDDNEHPEHKIYRKSAIRFSLLQRIRHIVSEEQKGNHKYPLHKQGSKSMGEKIAHPDYVDPQKLLGSRHCSQLSLATVPGDKDEDGDMMGEPELLDLTINTKEALSELEKRLDGINSTDNCNEPDTGQRSLVNSSRGVSAAKSEISLNSSQNSDSYYESILEDSLTEEYVQDSSGKLVAKQDSFSSNESKSLFIQKYKKFESGATKSSTSKNLHQEKKPAIRRPTKAPPPIPIKPRGLTVNVRNSSGERSETTMVNSNKVSYSRTSFTRSMNNISENGGQRSTSWVKTMVGRFE